MVFHAIFSPSPEGIVNNRRRNKVTDGILEFSIWIAMYLKTREYA